ncbi:MMPL family transporter [Paenibacillus eucommiae]|uniref:RND superfamily putative drug exporter n=1 Tax=Paenibacillus eucommiae TaxID=1355755 RepID=A0ABS4IW93_9BACL|nr:MMPL family transporter [Paenibacillus eucommiae]MBP1991121.1 RND superfamily putative drug exporter [Paenibacillus eucommiae]
MNRSLHTWARFISSPKGAKIVVICWLLIIIVLSGIAPGAKKHAISSDEQSIHENTPSAVAQSLLEEQFPSEDGLPALLVFHGQQAITDDERAKISGISEWLSSADKPENIASAMPFHQFPEALQDQLFSDDQTTVLLNASLRKDLESDQIFKTLEQIRSKVEHTGLGNIQFEITGPAGIGADTISLFKNADLVLMFATIGLILILLMIIYRSPLLAIIPLVIAGMVYQVVDRVLGLAAKNGWFIVDKQALSIMMILLFAVLTDYCLFIFSRYREELKKIGSKNDAMKIALSQVAEPILFSGGTVLAAMLTLFTAVFKPYHHFAPVFSVALVVILLGGLTLIPAVFTLIGRKAFWPFVPKLEDKEMKPTGFWTRTGAFVTKKPAVTAGVLLLVLISASMNVVTVKYSFNLLKSFPDDISSRQGFEILEQRFPQGQLAPATVILQSDDEIVLDSSFTAKLIALTESIKKQAGVSGISPEITPELAAEDAALPRNFLSEQKNAIKLQMTLQDNPYDQAALDVMEVFRSSEKSLLQQSGFDPSRYTLQYAGQTAEKLDVRSMNQRDTVMTFSLIAIFIAIMLAFQARSIALALTMLATMLLSYTATLGISWLVFHTLLGYDAISYRLPLYTFVFLIALGVDYNIMLVSRIKEEARKYAWKEAISRGVALTGGVISSAGIILAATFCVLITQPLQELFLFGLMMAIGILMDTFLVRGMLLPAIMTYMGKRSHAKQQADSISIIRK